MIKRITICALSMAFTLSPAAKAAPAADDLNKVLARLDEESMRFKSASADITWDNVQTVPILDQDQQTGTVIFERKSGQVEVAIHLRAENGKPIHKDLVYTGGKGELYDALLKQVQVFQVGNKRSELETFLTLGFGGSGKDLEKSWNITYVGNDPVNGAAAVKLQLVPRDADMAKTVPKVILWVDMDKGVAVKQQRFDASGNYVVFTYAGVKLNVSVPSAAFELKVPAGTPTVTH